MPNVLTPERAKAFYDRFGSKQDAQGFYEDHALALLISHASFESARLVFELGCGTGRLAKSLLQESLAPSACYYGTDLSTTMVGLASARLSPFADRAVVMQATASSHLPLGDSTADRFLSTYVLDLLSITAIKAVLLEAHRVLTTGGKLCLVGITHGRTLTSRLVMAGWSLIHRVAPAAVGGCRPISLLPLLDRTAWQPELHQVSTSFGIASEVLVASRVTPDQSRPAA